VPAVMSTYVLLRAQLMIPHVQPKIPRVQPKIPRVQPKIPCVQPYSLIWNSVPNIDVVHGARLAPVNRVVERRQFN
jgi:hypothetical protein